MDYLKIRTIIVIISLVAFFISLFATWENINFAIFFPLIFAYFLYFIIPNNITLTPGLTIALGVMVVRYVVSIIFFTQSTLRYDFCRFNDDVFITFFLMIIEMLVIMFTIRKYGVKNKTFHRSDNILEYNYFLPIIFLLLSILFSVLDPIPLSRYHFILEHTETLEVTELEGTTSGLPRLLQYTHLILLPAVFTYFYKKYKNKSTRKNLYILFASTLMLGCFYTDQSRNSMLIPLFALFFLFYKYLKEHTNKLILIFFLVGGTSMLYLSVVKFFKTTELSEVKIEEDRGGTYKYLNDYFGGFREVYLGVKHRDKMASNINIMTLYNELFSHVPIFSSFADKENRTVTFYNRLGYFTDHIMPTIMQGYVYFGILLAWLFSFLIFRIILYLDKLYITETDIGNSFLYAYGSCSAGWLHPGNFTIISNSITTILILYMFLSISKYIASKK